MIAFSRVIRAILFLAGVCISGAILLAADRRSADWFYTPFSKDSAHHRPIGTAAIYSSADDPATRDFQQGGAFNINVGSHPWGCGIWEAKPDDPLFTVTHEALDGDGRTSEFPVTCRLPLNMVMVQARNSSGNFDGVLVVYDRASDTIHHFRQFNWHTETPTPAAKPTAGSHKTWSIRGVGHSAELGHAVGTSASGVAAMFGILRGWEVKAVGHRIGHALQMVLPRRPNHMQGKILLGREVWWPAVSMDGSAYTNAKDNSGHVPYGSLWAIPPVEKGGPDLMNLGLSEMGLRLAECLRDYGAYAVDGGGATALRADQDFEPRLAKELKAQTALFYKYLRLVVNSVPDEGKVKFNVGDSRTAPTGGPSKRLVAGSVPAGGGTPLAPNTAIDAVPAPASRVVPRDREALIKAALEGGESIWTAALDPARHNIRTGTTLTYALTLCEAKVHPERLEMLVDLAFRLQDRDPQSPTYGSFRWLWNHDKVTDANAIEFTMQPAAVLWLKHRDTLPRAARDKLREMLEPAAVVASLRHRVSDGYTNIALMSASNLIILGEGLNRTDVADEGYKRLQAVFDVTQKSGIREYVSPDYYGIDLDALQLAAAFAQRPTGRKQAQALVQLFWTDVAAHFWWPNRKLAGAHSRNYDYLHGLGGLDRQLAAAGWIDVGREEGASIILPAVARWALPPELVEMSESKLPRLVRQMWGGAALPQVTPGAPAAPAAADGKVWAAATHWLGRDVTLSVGGKNYAVIDQALTVDFPGPRDSVRCYFIPDGRGDPYGKSKIPWRGHPKAVHLAPFFAAVQETKDALSVVIYRNEDVPPECTTLESHFVMPRDVDAIYVGEQRVAFASGAARSIPLEGAAVFLRKGSAAVAVRVPAARTLAGETAPSALVWDNNEWGAIRLTVDHRKTPLAAKVAPLAVFQVRVGSELSEAAFTEFRRQFAAERCEVSIEPNRVAVNSPASGGGKPLAIAAAAPWTSPSQLEPSVPRVILEIDGEDIGRRLLDAAQ